MKKLSFEQKKMKNFIGKRFNGSAVTIKKHNERALKIASAIYSRFGLHVYQYQQKHILWFIEESLADYAQGTRYNYYLTLLKVINLDEKMVCWESRLKKSYKR